MVSQSGGAESAYTRYDAAVTDLACQWLTDQGPDEPWVLYVGLVAPHFPYFAPPEFFALYDPDQMPEPTMRPEHGHVRHPWVQRFADVLPGLDGANTEQERRRAAAAYYGLVSYLDHNIGRILAALDASGQTRHTLVIYTSDHGDMVGSRGLWGKSVMYTESAGVPLVMAGPEVPANRVCNTPVSLIDMFPTILEAARVPDPNSATRPGKSLLAIAHGDHDHHPVFSEYHAMGAVSGAFLIRKEAHVLHHYVGYEAELFNLADDPDQTSNLADDPASAAILADLLAELNSVCDPRQVDAAAKADQAALVDRFGGPAAAALIGTPDATPPPQIKE
jgi:choline-sulfatase